MPAGERKEPAMTMESEHTDPTATAEPAVNLHRYRLEYARGPEMRYVGHLDTQLVWERTMRRARLPVAFTQGFSPRPRFHMASALPLGFTSRCELCDLWLNEPLEAEDLREKLQKVAPPGLLLTTVTEISLGLPALQTQVLSADYHALLLELPAGFDLIAAVQGLLGAASLPRTRREKTYDLRPLIEDLQLIKIAPDSDSALITMRLAAREGSTGRPDEVIAALGLDPASARVERTRLLLTA